jgi:hypothetical protein
MRIRMLNRRWGLGLVFVALMAAGCATKSINQVLGDPSRYRNDTITVRGTVAESASVLGRGVYRITDRDQGLWVVTTGGAPRKGARVNVTGRVQKATIRAGLAACSTCRGRFRAAWC